jgi:thiol-disulfide isomerase/thioredoxin
LNPLSKRQKENILAYFSNPTFADILFAENEKILLWMNEIEKNKQTNIVVNETPSAVKGELTDAIISKYKGKAVLIDFWATWCGPCMEAMEKFRTIKEEFSNKDIVFVYITNTSSPKELWRKRVTEIGNEHYYLDSEEWESISYSDKYGFKGIPSYIIFDTKGEVRHKFTGYPGNEKMRAMIEELLP